MPRSLLCFSILHLPGDQRFIAWFFRVMMMEVCIFWIPKSKQIFQKMRPTWQVKSNKWSPLEVYLHAGFGSFDFCEISKKQIFGLVDFFWKVEKWLVKNHTFEAESWLFCCLFTNYTSTLAYSLVVSEIDSFTVNFLHIIFWCNDLIFINIFRIGWNYKLCSTQLAKQDAKWAPRRIVVLWGEMALFPLSRRK